MANRQRNIRLRFRVTEKEHEVIKEKMNELHTSNLEAYLRKMSIDGYILQLDTTDIRELVRLLRVTSNSLNQLARKANQGDSVVQGDVDVLVESYDKLWEMAEEIMIRLSNV